MRNEREILAGGKIDVGSFLLLAARPCAGEADEEIVAEAWDFERINAGYDGHLRILDQHPEGSLRDPALAKALRQWAAREREAWQTAVSIDPLLPERLLPEGYLGRQAWRRRVEVLRQASRQLRTFSGNP